jgi:2-polyprenyl-3-methyl-5-hydroxy-6-metoxy-1,4-benzoquinol methylase
VRPELLDILRCPQSQQRLRLEKPLISDGRIREAELVSEDGRQRYQVREFIPRFVPASNYADNFGMQWNRFRQTQLDSFSGRPISAQRFWKATAWPAAELSGAWVLDVGCGAGRFAEVALNAGARVVALDYSSAVDACLQNLRDRPNLHIVQGDIYALPFARQTFPFVYSLGVLQHTPDVARAFAALPPMVAPGGRLCVDFYERSWKSALLPKYWLRPFTRRMPKAKLFALCERLVPKLLPLSHALNRVPVFGSTLRRVVPVASHEGLALSVTQQREWALLDTFDWLAPEYDNPQTAATVRRWLEQSDLAAVEVLKAGHLTARGTAPHATGH